MSNSERYLNRLYGKYVESNKIMQLRDRFTSSGFAGKSDLPLLVYLVLLTGMQKTPVSLLIKGPSGAGKSMALRTGKQFIPQEAYEEFEGMSEKALVYLKDLVLKHKHLIIGEASGMADGQGRTLLRQLLSEGKVRYATVESTEKGLKGSELPTLEGPTGLIMTTTAIGIHPEDESRMLSVNINESEQQIQAALVAIAVGRKPGATVDLEPWHQHYREMKASVKEVVIPYALELAFALPKSDDKIKRDFPHVLALIRASAMLHADEREQTDNGAIIANEDDYCLIHSLVDEAVSQSLDKKVSDAVRAVVETVQELNANGQRGLTISQIATKADRSVSAISRTVAKAIEGGYLRNETSGQGREASIYVGSRELKNESALPHPAKLFGWDSTPRVAPTFDHLDTLRGEVTEEEEFHRIPVEKDPLFDW